MNVAQMYKQDSIDRIDAAWSALLSRCGIQPGQADFELHARHDILRALGWDGSVKAPKTRGKAALAGFYYRDNNGDGAFTPDAGEKLSATLLGVPTLDGSDAPVKTYAYTFFFAPVAVGQTVTLRFDVDGVAPFEASATIREGLNILHLQIAPTKPLTYIGAHSHFDPEWRAFYEEYLAEAVPHMVNRVELLQTQAEHCFSLDEECATRPLFERYPELIDEIRQRIKDGTIEPKGIVSAGELVLPHGESMIRQMTLGEQMLSDYLGMTVRPDSLWNIDNYGVCFQFAQMMAKAGRKYMYLGEYNHYQGTKFVPSDQPFSDPRAYEHFEFWLESPDGSRVLVHRTPYYTTMLGPRIPQDQMLSHNSAFSPFGGDFEDANPDLPGFIRSLNDPNAAYDGENPKRYSPEDTPWITLPEGEGKYILATSEQFFHAIENDPDLPVIRADSRIGMWTGSYESRIRGRKKNRLNEMLLMATETLSTAAHLAGLEKVCSDLRESWYHLLINNHHDPQLCMMGPEELYYEVLQRYDQVQHRTATVLNQTLKYLTDDIKTNTAEGSPVVVFNPHAWTQTRVVGLWLDREEFPKGEVHIRDFDGNIIPSQVVKLEGHPFRILRFQAVDLPPGGWRTYYLTENSCGCPQGMHIDETRLENDYVRVELEDGLIQRIIEKDTNTVVFEATDAASVGELFVFKDEGCIAQIRPPAEEFMIDPPIIARSRDAKRTVRIVENGCVCIVLDVTFELDGSEFRQSLALAKDSRALDIDIRASWNADHITPGDGRRIRMALPVKFKNPSVIHDVPYAVMNYHQTDEIQPTTSFIAVANADETVGAALVHDGVPSQQVSRDCMWQTLFRSVRMPGELGGREWDPPCGWDIEGDVALDSGGHHLSHRLFVYPGTWRENHMAREAMVHQTPQLLRCASRHGGEQAGEYWTVEVEPGDVLMSSWKQSDFTTATIVRLVNPTDAAVTGKLKINFPVGRVEEVNLREEPMKPLSIEDGEIDLEFGPYEIKTIRLGATE
jgi:alpha-mannosidase